MLSASTARFIVGVIGNVISFGLFLSPCPTFYKIFKSKSVEEFKPDPYMVTILNCALWVFYGMPFVHPDSILVVTINGFGLVVEIVYLTIFIIYSTKQGRKKVFTFVTTEAVVFAAFAALTLIFAHGTTKRSLIVGICCDILNIMMYMSPFTIMKKVIQTKSVKYMPFWLSLAGFLNGSVWTAYALIKFDIYILVSNGLGAIGGFLQLVLYACYYSSTPKDDDEIVDGAKPTELQLSSSNAAARV